MITWVALSRCYPLLAVCKADLSYYSPKTIADTNNLRVILLTLTFSFFVTQFRCHLTHQLVSSVFSPQDTTVFS
jgi:hypothetical protein